MNAASFLPVRPFPLRRLAALALAVSLVLMPHPGAAQEEADPLVARGDSLRAELERMTVEFDELHARLPGLAGEDSVVVARQARELSASRGATIRLMFCTHPAPMR